MNRKVDILVSIATNLSSWSFWKLLPGRLWIAACKRLIAILEFSLTDWLYAQAYPYDRYSRYDTLSSVDIELDTPADRYSRLA